MTYHVSLPVPALPTVDHSELLEQTETQRRTLEAQNEKLRQLVETERIAKQDAEKLIQTYVDAKKNAVKNMQEAQAELQKSVAKEEKMKKLLQETQKHTAKTEGTVGAGAFSLLQIIMGRKDDSIDVRVGWVQGWEVGMRRSVFWGTSAVRKPLLSKTSLKPELWCRRYRTNKI